MRRILAGSKECLDRCNAAGAVIPLQWRIVVLGTSVELASGSRFRELTRCGPNISRG